ncbi:hypothetical protein Cni_G24980 [Canna indica]|uniref:FMR1-interacting protein 1 conserved domain-containing protein n=1 Tax=Canna indica TaxID=4628 RepID=A0AAQ3QNS5_9LILI|nr:hypothetical protein Cni_G24980 [Canna indica]
MLPFFPSLHNQNQPQATPNDPSRQQQAAMFNQAQFPTPPVVNFGIQYPDFGGFSAGNVAPLMAQSPFLNCPTVPPMMQNNHLGVFPQQPAQFGGMAQNLNQQLLALQMLGQACGAPQNFQQFQGQLQGLNILNSLQSGVGSFLANNLHQNANFSGSLLNGQSCLPTMVTHGNQISSLNSHASSCLGSNYNGNYPVLAVENKNTSLNNAALSKEGNRNSFAHDNQHGSRTNQNNFQGPISQGPMKSHHSMKHKQPGNLQPQIFRSNDSGSDINSMGSPRNFSRNPQGQRQTEYKRFQKPHFQNSNNMKNNMRTFNGMGGRVQKNWREGKPQFAKFNKPNFTDRRRCPPVNYTENEIHQWIEARRKNYPTKANIEKKSTKSRANNEDADSDAKLRRQQLKEVLAKQAELGVEVAEIPPGYLSQSENQADGEENNSRGPNTNNHFSNKHNKRGRHGQEKWQSKRSKLRNDSSAVPAPIIKSREPTLLQKLLSSDIKRDNSKLLQVFRFMSLNSFFEHWPDKPLEFPSVTVKDMQSENGTADEKVPDLAGTNNVELNVGQGSPVKEIEDPNESCVVDDAVCASEDDGTDSSKFELDCGMISEEHVM